MAIIAILFGFMLSALGAIFYVVSATQAAASVDNPWVRYLTALIPAAFGLLLIILGLIANRSSSDKARMHVMHGAATLGLLGIALPVWRMIAGRLAGKEWDRALTEMALMALLCAVFIVLCVRSFIAVRRARQARGES